MAPEALTLGIETSCDETAVAVVAGTRDVRVSLVSSQISVHAEFGGVVPEIAAREHLKVLDGMVREALREANVAIGAIDRIAVTQGPGLIGALLVGVSYAKGLALATCKPLVPVNHVHAHVHGALLGLVASDDELFPALAAVVSGGHTHLYFMPSPTDFELIAYSVDDACGESFDKVAKLLGLGYPGGPAIEAIARNGDPDQVAMPRMISEKARMEFSYSGLKTHMVNLVAKGGSISGQRLADVCAAFQREALGQLVRKIVVGLELRPAARSVLIAGGVAANGELRRMIAEQVNRPAHLPGLRYCSDNAAMIAALGARAGAIAPNDPAAMPWDAFSRYQRAGSSRGTHGATP